jgi:hypothetical protein
MSFLELQRDDTIWQSYKPYEAATISHDYTSSPCSHYSSPGQALLEAVDNSGQITLKLDNDLQQLLQVSQQPNLTCILTQLIVIKYGVF